MKKIISIAIASIILASCSTAKIAKEQSIQVYQAELAQAYLNPKTTPLKGEEVTNFKGITFFPVDQKYKVQAQFTAVDDGKVIPFPTSAQKIKHYKVFGTIAFELDGETHRLTIYQSYPLTANDTHLFLPFMDETSGVTSYGGGRYLDLSLNDVAHTSTVTIDFNKTYNPYCAYSKYYSCPIPPSDNTLDVEINAGVSY